MIYLDNAATTRKKPQSVIDAFNYYLTEVGSSPGRGSYSIGIQASRMLYQARMTVSNFFGLRDPNTVFTKNSTEAINLFFRGFLKRGDHVVISPYEHNAVLRPLESMRNEGIIDYSIIASEDLMENDATIIRKYFRDNTSLIAMTLASNITGRIVYNSSLFLAAKQRGVSSFLDASQGAGVIRVNMEKNGIDFLAFTAHKDLKGLPGVGGLCSVEKLSFAPLIQGGTGILGHYKTNPDIYPDGYEAGTLNMPGIWALKAAIEYTLANHDENLKKEKSVIQYLERNLSEMERITVYDRDVERIGTLGFNVDGYAANDIVKILDDHGICTRGGIHCAILTHEMLGTTDTGIVRVSISENNNIDEIDELIRVLKDVK